jgi:hypothetical protein
LKWRLGGSLFVAFALLFWSRYFFLPYTHSFCVQAWCLATYPSLFSFVPFACLPGQLDIFLIILPFYLIFDSHPLCSLLLEVGRAVWCQCNILIGLAFGIECEMTLFEWHGQVWNGMV